MKPQTTNRMVVGASHALSWCRANTDLAMLAVMAVIVVTSWLAIELADEVLEGTTQRYDEWVLRLLRTPGDMTDPIGPAWFEDMWRDVTALGSATVLTLVTVACAGYCHRLGGLKPSPLGDSFSIIGGWRRIVMAVIRGSASTCTWCGSRSIVSGH